MDTIIPPGQIQQVQRETHDEIYRKSWKAVVDRCQKTLEWNDYTRALEVKTPNAFRDSLLQLHNKYPDKPSQEVINLLIPNIGHYEIFATSFVSMMASSVDVSMLWGLLFLVVKLSLESKGTIDRISKMLKDIGYQLRLLNEISQTITDYSKVKEDTVEIQLEITALWLNVIMFFREQQVGPLDELAWRQLNFIYNSAAKNIDEAVRRLKHVILFSSRQLQKFDLATLCRYLCLDTQGPEKAVFPCDTIPLPRNLEFFGQQDPLKQIDSLCRPNLTKTGIFSVAIFGLGGIGKSQIALEYAYSHRSEFDAIVWVSAENEISIQQGLSHAAVKALKLPGANPQAYQNNAVLLMDWLRTTDVKWLLVYDNVESSIIFETYWPVAHHGSILITTRRRTLTAQPINKSIEIFEFSPLHGAQFLIHSLRRDLVIEKDPEFQAAIRISVELNGLPLAISQMAALITARRMSLESFVDLYRNYQRKIHHERKRGSTYSGYKHSLDTVWQLSFDALEEEDRYCLGILALLVPDAIPLHLFEAPAKLAHVSALSFCTDEYSRGEVFEHLAELALIRVNLENAFLSIHRLVQFEFRSHRTRSQRQEDFDAAVLLLLAVFPPRGKGRVIDKNLELGERYILQVLALLHNYYDSQKELERLRSTRDFLNLVCDTTWFLEQGDTADNITFVLKVAFIAWNDWEAEDKDPLIHSFILTIAGLHDLWIGEFQIALTRTQQSLSITLENVPPDDELVLNAYNDMGLVYGSQGDYERGENYLSRAEELFRRDPDRYPLKGLLINANWARNSYCRGDFEDAETRLNRALEEANERKSVWWNAIIHMTFGSLFCRSNDLEAAERHLNDAGEAIEKFGKARNFQLNGLYAYRLGRLYLAQGRIEESIEQLEKAVSIDKIQLSPRGYRARNIYALSRALSASPSRKSEAAKTEHDALNVADKIIGQPMKLLQKDDNWDAFDLLVRIVER